MGPKYGVAKYTSTTQQGYPAEHHYPTAPAAGAAGAGTDPASLLHASLAVYMRSCLQRMFSAYPQIACHFKQ